jgi:uncharacterized RDD family membrane protein YckC
MVMGDDYISRVIDRMPRTTPLRTQIAMELRGHIVERIERGQPLDDVLRQLGDPATLGDSYLAAEPLAPASFWRRGAAKAIDVLVFLACAAPLAWLAWRLVGQFAIFMLPVLVFVFPAYLVVAEYRFERTVGKHLLGLRVVQESGARIGLGQSFVRQLPQFLQVFWIDVLFALFTERSQRAFELLSRTRVVTVPGRVLNDAS